MLEHGALAALTAEERTEAVFDHLGRECLRAAALIADDDPVTASRLSSIGAAWSSAAPDLLLHRGRALGRPSGQMPLLRRVK